MTDPTSFVKAEEMYKHRSHRAVNGFSTYDWWNFDGYLAFVIAGGLKKFRNEGSGYPADLTIEQWNTLLDIMIEGFEGWQNKFVVDTFEEEKELARELGVALDIFKAYFTSLWD